MQTAYCSFYLFSSSSSSLVSFFFNLFPFLFPYFLLYSVPSVRSYTFISFYYQCFQLAACRCHSVVSDLDGILTEHSSYFSTIFNFKFLFDHLRLKKYVLRTFEIFSFSLKSFFTGQKKHLAMLTGIRCFNCSINFRDRGTIGHLCKNVTAVINFGGAWKEARVQKVVRQGRSLSRSLLLNPYNHGAVNEINKQRV